jgi:hypothetical protein
MSISFASVAILICAQDMPLSAEGQPCKLLAIRCNSWRTAANGKRDSRRNQGWLVRDAGRQMLAGPLSPPGACHLEFIAALVFIAATGSGTAGYFLHKPLVLWPSVGVMAVSLPFTMVSSAANLGRKSASEAMDAIDLYNDNYIRRDQLVVTPVTDGQ